MDMHEVVTQVTSLVALQQFASAFDAAHCCEKATALRFVASGGGGGALAFMDTETRELAFRVVDKSMSLHKERTVVDAHSNLPVATLRTSLMHRTPTYSAYARTEHEETPESFKFELEARGKLRMEFLDLVAEQRSVIGCDGPVQAENGESVLEFWLVRGNNEVRQAIARIRYAAAPKEAADGKAPNSPSRRGGVLEVAKGVDLLMMVLLCIGLDDQRPSKAG